MGDGAVAGVGVIAELHRMHWRDLAEHVRSTVGQVDALIVDAPYDARTHAGHDAGKGSFGQDDRRSIHYAPWTAGDVSDFIGTWAPVCRGWMVSITCDGLIEAWRAGYETAGRVAFAHVPAIETGATDRKHQDGPASWTTNVMPSRPRGGQWIGWGQPRSFYLGPREAKPVIGGKPVWLMREILEDYTRPGDLVCDPCMGAGTTLLAAKLLGRQYIGGDIDENHVAIARERLRDLPAEPKKGTLALPWSDE